MDPCNNGILTATARRSIRRISRLNAPYQSRQSLAESTSTSFTTDFATCPMASIEEETTQPLHSSTPQPSLRTINDSMEGSSSSLDSTLQISETTEGAADPAMQKESEITVQGNIIHASEQFFSQLISQNQRLAESKFTNTHFSTGKLHISNLNLRLPKHKKLHVKNLRQTYFYLHIVRYYPESAQVVSKHWKASKNVMFTGVSQHTVRTHKIETSFFKAACLVSY